MVVHVVSDAFVGTVAQAITFWHMHDKPSYRGLSPFVMVENVLKEWEISK
jgi:hypothetical protein